MKKRILSLALALVLALSLLPTAMAAGMQYDDTTGHWAEGSIDRWSEYNIVEGNNGHFYPDMSLTRGQMAKILANTLGLADQGTENPFADVPADAWYTPYVLRCYVAGVMVGDGQRANPEATITRQETMTALARALNISPVEDADLSAYADGDAVADWAAPYVAAMTQAGIVNGVGNNRLAPADNINRASIMAVLNRAVAQYINVPGTYDLTETEGLVLVAAGDVTLTGKTAANILVAAAATGKKITFDKAQVTGSITVQADNAKVVSKNNSSLPQIVALGEGVQTETVRPNRVYGGGSTPSTPTYTNLTIAEAKSVTEAATYQDVTITDAVEDGTVSLANMTILGNLYIYGGGANTVNLTNVTIRGKIIMAKVGGERPRLNLTNTPVSTVEVNQPATIEADAASAVTAVQAKADVYVIGADTAVATVTVPAEAEKTVAVNVTAGTVTKVEAKGETTVTGAANSVAQVVAKASVTVAADAVQQVEVPASAPADVTVAVTGSGCVDVAVNSENGVTVTTQEGGASVTISSDLPTLPDVTVDGETVTHIHKWDEGRVNPAPTCTTPGEKTYSCIIEGCDTNSEKEGNQIAFKIEVIPALGHTEVIDQAVAATCTEAGKTEGKHCSVCNAVLAAQEAVAALGHTEVVDPAVAATCTQAGKTAGKHCSVCDAIIAAQKTVAALGHDWDQGVVTLEPNEVTEGVKTYTCAVCGAAKTEVIPCIPEVEIPEGAPYVTLGVNYGTETQYISFNFKLDGVKPLEGKRTLEGIVDTVAISIGNVQVESTQGKYVYYYENRNEYSLPCTPYNETWFEELEKVGDCVTGLTITLTPSSDVTLTQTELKNETFMLRLVAGSALDQNSYELEYNEPEKRAYLNGLTPAFYHTLIAFDGRSSSFDPHAISLMTAYNSDNNSARQYIPMDEMYGTDRIYENFRKQALFLGQTSAAVSGNVMVVTESEIKFGPIHGRYPFGDPYTDLPKATVKYRPKTDGRVLEGFIWTVPEEVEMTGGMAPYFTDAGWIPVGSSWNKDLTETGSWLESADTIFNAYIQEYCDWITLDDIQYHGGQIWGGVDGTSQLVATAPWIKVCPTNGGAINLVKWGNGYEEPSTGEWIGLWRFQDPPDGCYWKVYINTNNGDRYVFREMDETNTFNKSEFEGDDMVIWYWNGQLVPDEDGTLHMNVTYYTQFNFIDETT